MEKKPEKAKDLIDSKPRDNYSIRIPPNATPEEIDEFMKEFMKRWNRKSESNGPTSKPEQGGS